jgi:hypothetical protein
LILRATILTERIVKILEYQDSIPLNGVDFLEKETLKD